MKVFPVWARDIRLFVILLFVALAISGCKKQHLYAAYACGNITINVDPSYNTDPYPRYVDQRAVYLCDNNYTITWVPGPHVKKFQIQFVGPDLPFRTATTFVGTTQPVTSPTLADPGQLTIFKYNILITDNSDATYESDPHVVGGGGIVTRTGP
ncbi:MAG: hypothetical protein WBL50_23350 [Candidatus Acidiferrum sp.]